MNETKLAPLKETVIEEAILAINATWVTENRRIDQSVLAPLVKRVRGTRSYGSAALEPGKCRGRKNRCLHHDAACAMGLRSRLCAVK